MASEPAYVVGTATIGSPVVSATALARPVVEPPPTLTSDVDVVLARDRPGALGDLDRHVPDHVGVEHGHGYAGQHGLGPVRVGRDRHHPRPLEPAYLLGHRVGGLARGEVHALRQGLVCEAQGVRGHASIIDAQQAGRHATAPARRADRPSWEILRSPRWPGWARGGPALATHPSQESVAGPATRTAG